MQCMNHTGFAPSHVGCMCFPGLHCSGSRLLCRGTLQSRPGFCALPRSKLLRFRFLGIPQRHRVGWGCVLCPSQVHVAQATRYLVSTLSPDVWWSYPGGLSLPPSQLLTYLGVQWEHRLRCAMCLLWGADLWLRPSWWMSIVQNPKKSWLATKLACSLVEDAVSGLRLPLSGFGCLLPASLPLAGEGPVLSQLTLLWYSLSPLFCEQVWPCLRLGLFMGKFSLSLFFLSLSGYPTVWVAISR